MNIAFVIDTSLSMIQLFDKRLSFLDSAKAAVEKFISIRESQRKIDKYFLITTNINSNEHMKELDYKNTSILSSWEDSLQHFIFQLRLLRPSL